MQQPGVENPIDLSVIIVNHQTRELLHNCLYSLQRVSDGIRLQIIVVDNGSVDGSPEMVIREFPEVVLIKNPMNEGFAKPNNQGLQIATGRYSILLNSDTIVRPRALQKLIHFMDQHSDVGACGPRLLNPDGTLQPSCRSFPSVWRFFCDMSGLENLFPLSVFGNFETRFAHDHDREVDQPMGAALMVRREVIESVGCLDERFSIYYNEVDWCRRITESGWKIYFVHDAEIVHYGGKTTEITNRSSAQFDEMNRNCLAYYRKHFGRAGTFIYLTIMTIGFAARVVFWRMALLRQRSDVATGRLLSAQKFLEFGARCLLNPTSWWQTM